MKASATGQGTRSTAAWRIARLALFGGPLLLAAIWFGHRLGRDWLEFEQWISGLGYWGPVCLILAMALLSLVMFPDTPFAMIAGALFGVGWGTVYAFIGVFLGAMVNFWVARLLLRSRVHRFLEGHPHWLAVEDAASREGLRLQLLIRLTPVHSALFSYVMGASRVTCAAFAVGCLAIIPGLMVEVYCGHLAGHVAGLASGTKPHSPIQTVATVCGLLIAIAVMAYVTKLARQAIAQSEDRQSPPLNGTGDQGKSGGEGVNIEDILA